jgi:hypothetical protein
LPLRYIGAEWITAGGTFRRSPGSPGWPRVWPDSKPLPMDDDARIAVRSLAAPAAGRGDRRVPRKDPERYFDERR